MKTFRWRVKEVALKQGLTSMLLAKQTGINKNTATALWHGRPTRVDLVTLARLCEALHCRLEDLLELVDERRTTTLAVRSSAHQRRRLGEAAAPLATAPLARAISIAGIADTCGDRNDVVAEVSGASLPELAVRAALRTRGLVVTPII